MEKYAQTKLKRGEFTIIIAEKDAALRTTLAAVLSYHGCRVFQAENLNAAISYVDRVRNLDVLFAD